MEGHPYSDCKTFSGEQNKKINAFLDEVGTIGYSSDVSNQQIGALEPKRFLHGPRKWSITG